MEGCNGAFLTEVIGLDQVTEQMHEEMMAKGRLVPDGKRWVEVEPVITKRVKWTRKEEQEGQAKVKKKKGKGKGEEWGSKRRRIGRGGTKRKRGDEMEVS